MATTTIRNGVDVDRLLQTINAIKGDAGAPPSRPPGEASRDMMVRSFLLH